MPTYDFACDHGHPDYEVFCSVSAREAPHGCPVCGTAGHRVILRAPALCTTIVPMHLTSKKVSAGYIHTHGDKDATRTMSGPYGMVQRKDSNAYVDHVYRPDSKSSVKEARRNASKA